MLSHLPQSKQQEVKQLYWELDGLVHSKVGTWTPYDRGDILWSKSAPSLSSITGLDSECLRPTAPFAFTKTVLCMHLKLLCLVVHTSMPILLI